MGTASSGPQPRPAGFARTASQERARRNAIGLSKLYPAAYRRFKETVTCGVLFPVRDTEGHITGGLPCRPEQILEAARLIVEYHDGKPAITLQTGDIGGIWGLLALSGAPQLPATLNPELPAEAASTTEPPEPPTR